MAVRPRFLLLFRSFLLTFVTARPPLHPQPVAARPGRAWPVVLPPGRISSLTA